jgi:hypothetical protein
MKSDIQSLYEYRNRFKGIPSEPTTPLTLFQTYEEWLAENPNGYRSCDDTRSEHELVTARLSSCLG